MKTKKNIIRLTESDLHRIIAKSVKNVLNEAGHLYFKDEDGNIHTNSRETFRGIPGTTFIWHGEWSDPEVIYKGKSLNPDDIDESFWQAYKDYGYEEIGHKRPTEEGFDEWIKQQDKGWMQSPLDDIIWGMEQ